MTYISQVIADGAVGFWKLSEASGTSAVDATGNSNGTYAGAITYGVTGLPGGGGLTAVQNTTSSVNNNVKSGSVAANQLVDTFTIEVWVKRTATQSATQRIVGGGNAGGPQLGFDATNHLSAAKQGVGSAIASSTTSLTDTASFHHIVWTKAAAASHLYIDGTDVTSAGTNQTFAANTVGWWAMIDNSNNNPPPAGVTFAMYAIYPTALSAATVLNHYTLGSASAPVNTVAPAVTGTATVGSVLTTTNGTWTDAGSPTFTYAWQRDVAGNGVYSNIASATASTYTLVSADDTCHVRCVVTDTDANGSTAANSNATAIVTFAVPVNSVAPTVSGSTVVGSVLTSTTGTWSNTPTSYGYQWTRDGVNIASATSSTYTSVSADATHAVGCKVTATNDGGTSAATASSNTISVVTAPSLSTVVGKTGTSGTAVMQKAGSGYTYITGKTGTSGTAVDQKGAGSFTKIKGH